jgi:hypothetical protein
MNLKVSLADAGNSGGKSLGARVPMRHARLVLHMTCILCEHQKGSCLWIFFLEKDVISEISMFVPFRGNPASIADSVLPAVDFAHQYVSMLARSIKHAMRRVYRLFEEAPMLYVYQAIRSDWRPLDEQIAVAGLALECRPIGQLKTIPYHTV